MLDARLGGLRPAALQDVDDDVLRAALGLPQLVRDEVAAHEHRVDQGGLGCGAERGRALLLVVMEVWAVGERGGRHCY